MQTKLKYSSRNKYQMLNEISCEELSQYEAILKQLSESVQ